ncbi:MAG: hypothetical protein ACX939_15430, partial [Hyphococcus sp.]
GASFEGGEGWPFNRIERALKQRCKDVRELDPQPANNRRTLAATDRTSDLKFLALTTHANGRRDTITEMLYASAFTGLIMTEERAARIDAQLEVTYAYEDEGDLYLVASPKIVGEFDEEFFGMQLEFFLTDLRNALRLILDDGAHARMAASELKALMNAAEPTQGPLRNRMDGNRFLADAVSMFGPREDCPTCNGKGRRFLFSSCKECSGRGFTR